MNKAPRSKSVVFCYVFTWLLLAALTALCIGMPFLMDRYMHWRVLPVTVCRVVLIAFFVCCVPAYTALISLLRILRQIRALQIFTGSNLRLLRLVSWCCALVAAVCFAAGFWYFPLFLVTAAMLFIFLIARVVCTCFQAAALLQEENKLTI